MVRHIVMWNFDESISKDDRESASKKIKNDLEALGDIIDGVVEIRVGLNTMTSSNVDIMLDSTFKDEKALNSYQSHPEHKKVGAFIKGLMCSRKCFDETI